MKVSTVLSYATDYEYWAREDEMKGGGDPDNWDTISEEFKRSKSRLRRAIRELGDS